MDLFPPGPRDPHGLHRVIWEEGREGDFALPADEPLTCVAYLAGPCPEVFLEPVAVGEPLPEMPLFLTTETYVPVPLDATYRAAFDAVPAYWRGPRPGRRPMSPPRPPVRSPGAGVKPAIPRWSAAAQG